MSVRARPARGWFSPPSPPTSSCALPGTAPLPVSEMDAPQTHRKTAASLRSAPDASENLRPKTASYVDRWRWTVFGAYYRGGAAARDDADIPTGVHLRISATRRARVIVQETLAGSKPVTCKTQASKWLSWPHAKPLPRIEPVGFVHLRTMYEVRLRQFLRRWRAGIVLLEGRSKTTGISNAARPVRPTFAGSSKSHKSGECMTHATCRTRPTLPAFTHAAAACACGRHDAVLFTAKKSSGRAAAAAASALASATSVVIGFSISTCLPAASARWPSAACDACDVHTITPSKTCERRVSPRRREGGYRSGRRRVPRRRRATDASRTASNDENVGQP